MIVLSIDTAFTVQGNIIHHGDGIGLCRCIFNDARSLSGRFPCQSALLSSQFINRLAISCCDIQDLPCIFRLNNRNLNVAGNLRALHGHDAFKRACPRERNIVNHTVEIPAHFRIQKQGFLFFRHKRSKFFLQFHIGKHLMHRDFDAGKQICSRNNILELHARFIVFIDQNRLLNICFKPFIHRSINVDSLPEGGICRQETQNK